MAIISVNALPFLLTNVILSNLIYLIMALISLIFLYYAHVFLAGTNINFVRMLENLPIFADVILTLFS